MQRPPRRALAALPSLAILPLLLLPCASARANDAPGAQPHGRSLHGTPLAAASPAPAAGRSLFATLDAEVRGGRLSADAAAMQRFYGVFRPDLLDPAWAALSRDDAPRCATQLLTDLRVRWDRLSPSERHVVDLETSPFYRSWIAEGGLSWEQGDADLARTAGRNTCFTPEQALDEGPFEETLASDHFVIHYDLGGDVTQPRINSLSGYFEESFDVETGELGFYQPENMDSYELLVVVDNFPSASTGGYTTVAYCGMTSYMPFIVVNSDWFPDAESLRAVAPHEFFHSIQMVYALEEMFFTQDSPNAWFIEGSAVYQETVVYPNLYNVQASQAFRWVSEPWRSLFTWDQGGFQYGTFLFPASIRHSLDGDSSWHRELWQKVYGRTGYDLRDEFDELLQERGTSFLEQYGLFIERAATMDFGFNQWLIPPLGMDEASGGYYDDSVLEKHDEDEFPVDESVDGGSEHDDVRPEYLGTSFVWFDSDGIDDGTGVLFHFEGDADVQGEEVDWEVRFVAIEDDEAKDTHRLELSDKLNDDGELSRRVGEIVLNEFGNEYDGAMLVASPVSETDGQQASFWYEAELVDSVDGEGFSEVPPPEVADGGDDDGRGAGAGCRGALSGAAPARSLPAGSGLLLGAALAVRTRRRRAP
jgi:hypothetical protein